MKTKQITVRLSEEEAKRIEEAAKEEELSLSAFFRKAAKFYLANKND